MRIPRAPHRGATFALIVALLLTTSFPAAAAHTVNACPITLEKLSEEVLQKARESYGVPADAENKTVGHRAVREENVRAALAAVDRQLGVLADAAKELEEDPTPAFDACGTDAVCQKKVAIRFRHKFAAVMAAVSQTLFGVGSARKRVEAKYREIAAVQVDAFLANYHSDEGSPSETDRQALAKRVADAALKQSQEPVTVKGVAKSFWKPFGEAISAVTFRELRRPGTDFEKGVNEARRDFSLNFGIVLALQLAAHGLKMLHDWQSGNPVQFWGMLWVYANTFVMMALQAEVGARTQRPLDANVGIRNAEDAIRALPGILHGERGYFKDSLAKFFGFIALVPYELLSNVAMRSLNMIALGGVAALGGGKILKITLQNFYATCAFGLYLAVRWAVLDKWFNLNLLPAWRTGKMAEVKEAYAALEASGLPSTLGARDVYRQLTPWYRRPVAATVDLITSPFRAFGNWWRGGTSEAERHELAEARKIADRLSDTPEMHRFLATYRGSIWPRVIEGTWRLGSGLFDSFLFFWLFTEKKAPNSEPATSP